MTLTESAVEKLFRDCLVRDGDEGPELEIEGITFSARFSRGKLEVRRAEVRDFLLQLPHAFRRSVGGGWSFLNVCITEDHGQWADHQRSAEMLVMLGMATGDVALLLPREHWGAFPGELPYYVIEA